MRRVNRLFRLAVAVLALLPAGGCATVMSGGNRTGQSADAQRYASENIEKSLSPFREVVRGAEVSVHAGKAPGTALQYPLVAFARSFLLEMIPAEGGTYVGERGGDVRLEVHSVQAGLTATERNFTAPLGNNIRVPLLYAEGFGGSSGLVVLAMDREGNLIPRKADRAGNGGTEYFLFRFIGPIGP
ncbi:MAG TPA: hypothetical protein VF847_05890 [Candidatus Deferrimicrobiaceae bacterium]